MQSYPNYAWGWAGAGNTPLRRWQRDLHQGGMSDALIVHWTKGIRARNEVRGPYAHVIDVVPTVLEALGLEPPAELDGVAQAPIEGVSFAHTFDDGGAPTKKTVQYDEMIGSRAIWHDGWKAVAEQQQGVLLAHGSWFAGYSLSVKENRLHSVHNYLGLAEHRVSSNEPIPSGPMTLRFEFTKAGEHRGVGALYVGDRKVGDGEIPQTVPAAIETSGEGRCGGYDSGLPATEDYRAPFRFTGTIKRVVVEVDGPAHVDADASVRARWPRSERIRGGRGSMDYQRLSMPIGEAMFTQRSIRRFRPDPIPMEDIRLIVEAAVKAPNGGNRQPARFLVLTDRARIKEFAPLYHEAWWAKRRDEGRPWTRREEIPPEERGYQAAARLADEIGDAPCIVFAFGEGGAPANSVLPATQNLMLAARALGIGSVPTTLHPQVMERFYQMFGVPQDASFHFCIPMGYPRGSFGPTSRKPTSETTYLNRWGGAVPWS